MASIDGSSVSKDEAPKTRLFDLPNEILIHILDAFQTLPLLWLRATSHRLQHLVIKILHARLIEAASFHNRKLLIECYHPSARVTEPIIYCDYLGTPGLSDSLEGRGSTNDITNHDVGEGPLKKLYSRFRPTRNEPESNEDQHSAGGSIGSKRNNAAESSNKNTSSDVVTHDVSLEAHENFSQLQFSARLGQTGPRKGIFLSIVDILEKKTFRLFRQWLNATARDPKCLKPIWVDGNKKVAGLKVHVQERAWRRDRPILLREDEDQAVNFTLKLEELLISTTHLLLAVEQSLLETENENGKAMIFATFVSPTNGQVEMETGA